MKIKHLYLLIAIFGSLVPYFHFLNFLSSHGLDSAEFFNQMLEQPISAFFAWDVILSTVAMIVLVFREGMRLNMKALGLYVFLTSRWEFPWPYPPFYTPGRRPWNSSPNDSLYLVGILRNLRE